MGDDAQAADGRLWTVQDVGDYLRLRPFTIRTMVRRRRLPAIVEGRRIIRFDPDEIKDWVIKHKRRPR